MTINSRSAKLSSPNVKVQDVPDRPTIGTAVVNVDTIQVPFTPAATGGQAAVYRAVSSPGGIEAISFGSSPISVPNLDDGVARTFTVRGETSTGATTGFTTASNSVSVPRSAMEFISSFTVPPSENGSFNDVGLTNIPQTYQDLFLVAQARTTFTSASGIFAMYFNGDSGSTSTRSQTQLIGNGSSASSNRTTNDIRIHIPDSNMLYASSTAGVFGSAAIHILNYANTSTFKTTLSRWAGDANGSGSTNLSVGLIRNTAAISQINFATYGQGLYVPGCTFRLYGIRAGN